MALALVNSGGLAFTTEFLPKFNLAFFNSRRAPRGGSVAATIGPGRMCPSARRGATHYYRWIQCGGAARHLTGGPNGSLAGTHRHVQLTRAEEQRGEQKRNDEIEQPEQQQRGQQLFFFQARQSDQHRRLEYPEAAR